MNSPPTTPPGQTPAKQMLKVLLIEDNPFDARLTQEALADAPGANFELEWSQRLSQGLARLAQGDIQLVLLDLTLPDSRGLVTVAKLRAEFPTIPLLVLTGLQDEAVGVESIKLGAEDYLVKGKYDVDLLVRSIRYSLERHRFQQERLEAQEWKQQLDQLREMDRLKSLFVPKAGREPAPQPPAPKPAAPPHFVEAPLQPESRRLEELERSVKRLQQIAEESLEYARVQVDGLVLVRHPLDLNAAILETSQDYQEPARDSGVRIETRVASDLPVLADAKRVRHVLSSLLANAIRSTPQGGRVLVESQILQDRAVVHIRDGGVGLLPEDLSRLFLPTHALPEPSADRGHRVLVGLYVARSIIEAHGGQLWYHPPAPGQESTFSWSMTLAGNNPGAGQ